MVANYVFDPEKVTYFAYVDKRGSKVAFGIKAKDRLQHIYTIGKTGTGKSTLLENMAIQDIISDEGVCFIDPHGKSAERLLEYVPKHRIKDVLYFAPFDVDLPVAFNILEDVGYEKRHLATDSILSVFKHIWKDAWSSRMEYILQNTLLALLEFPNTTLLDVNRMLINPEFRREVVASLTDPIVKRFWLEEFAGYSDRYAQEATPAIQNKIGQFISNPLIRNIVGQSKSSFDLQEFMDERKIIIMNLSKGQLGEQNAALLGSLITAKIYLASLSRASGDLESKPPFYVYVDEFQNVVNSSFENMLSEARKYRVSLMLAHQYIEQLDASTRASVFGNVGTMVAFNVGPQDAEVLESVFAPAFKAEELNALSKYQIALRLLIDGESSQPFLATTLPPIEPAPYSFKEEIIESSHRQYVRSKSGVEEFIAEIDKKRGSHSPGKMPSHLSAMGIGDSAQKKDISKSKAKKTALQQTASKPAEDKNPADILRKKQFKEPEGLKGPTELDSQDVKRSKPDLKATLDEVLSKGNDTKRDSQESQNPLDEIKSDMSAHPDTVIERATKLLDKLKAKSLNRRSIQSATAPKRESDENLTQQTEKLRKNESYTDKEQAQSLESSRKDSLQDREYVPAEPERVLSQSKEESGKNPDKKEDAEYTETRATAGAPEKPDSKLSEQLEETLANSDKMSDEELKAALESLLYEKD